MININENWRLTVEDTLNVTVEHRVPKKTKGKNSTFVLDDKGNQVYMWKVYGYFGTVENAIKSIAKQEHFNIAYHSKNISIGTLYKQMIKANEELSKDINELIKQLKKQKEV